MRRIFLALTMVVILLFTGCWKQIDDTLPEHPAILTWQEIPGYTDMPVEDMPDDSLTILGLVYQGRRYITYGQIKWKVDGDDIGPCIGYTDAENSLDPDTVAPGELDRVYLLKEDPEVNYLYYATNSGEMDVHEFYRAEDTKGKKIQEYSFIDRTPCAYYWGEE